MRREKLCVLLFEYIQRAGPRYNAAEIVHEVPLFDTVLFQHKAH